jgi:myo-inositol-1-phosphate synthase
MFDKCRDELAQIDRRLRPGTIRNVGPTIASLADWDLPGEEDETPRQTIERLRRDMSEFVKAEKLEHLIAVNVSSTEPKVIEADSLPATWPELDKLLDDQKCPLPASSLYAIAALGAGYSFLNFTPALGASPAAIDDLAQRSNTRHYGCDGKTGETLMKSVLAPMFALRNLQVLSWVGHNIFGNMDGQVLNDPANKHSKVASKDHLIREILGYKPNTLVSIEYLPDLGDWKTAWDHIHFKGFLGVPMTLQFTWQGCDSVLAAPLVLDMVRFTELARRRGEIGQMKFLASFFKSPYGVTEHSFERQYQWLEQWAEKSLKDE